MNNYNQYNQDIYSLSQWNIMNIPSSPTIKGLSTCNGTTCPCSVTQNTSKTLSVSAGSGTPPYTYHWIITQPNGTIDTTPTGSPVSYTFSQLGNYIVSVYVTDSCSPSQTSNVDSCTITVTEPAGIGYNCISPGNCQPAPVGTTGTFPDIQSCNVGCPIVIGWSCDPVTCPNDGTNYCVSGTCIPKKYAVYAGVGFGALFLLSLLK